MGVYCGAPSLGGRCCSYNSFLGVILDIIVKLPVQLNLLTGSAVWMGKPRSKPASYKHRGHTICCSGTSPETMCATNGRELSSIKQLWPFMNPPILCFPMQPWINREMENLLFHSNSKLTSLSPYINLLYNLSWHFSIGWYM